MGCCLKNSCTNIEGHRGFSSDCQLFSKDIKVLLTLKLKIRVSYKHTLFIAKTLLDNTIKKCEQVHRTYSNTLLWFNKKL